MADNGIADTALLVDPVYPVFGFDLVFSQIFLNGIIELLQLLRIARIRHPNINFGPNAGAYGD
ncbi:hypothetical protein D3C76_1802100 [compost metagenome]